MVDLEQDRLKIGLIILCAVKIVRTTPRKHFSMKWIGVILEFRHLKFLADFAAPLDRLRMTSN